MSLTKVLVERILSWPHGELDGRDVDAVRRLLIDHVAVAAWGSTVPAGALYREHVLGDLVGGFGVSMPIIGTTDRTNAVHAAMANSVAAACYEFDDTHTAGSLHPGSVVFPAALAAAALSGCSRRRFVWSVIIGYEVMCRVARASNPHAHRARHFHPTSTAGHFGAAAAAAVCLNLDVNTTIAALTLAGTAAGGSMQFVEEGGLTKQVHPAFAVQRGVTGAQLAARGFPGVEDPIAGRRAFLVAQSEDPRPERLVEDLDFGPREILNTGIKPYPSCRNTQAPLDALLALVADHRLGPRGLRSVTFGMIQSGVATVFEPEGRRRRPTSLADAQFSMPFVAAVALVDGQVGVGQFTHGRIADTSLRPLMDMVSCVHDPQLDARYPEQWPAWVEVTTTDGARLRKEVSHPRGDPENPLDSAALETKFEDLTADVFTDQARRRLLEEIADVESTRPIVDLLDAMGGHNTTAPVR